MERTHWRNIAEAGKKTASVLRPGRFNCITSLVASTCLVLATLPIVENEPKIPGLMVDVKCQGSTPIIEVQGNVTVPPQNK